MVLSHEIISNNEAYTKLLSNSLCLKPLCGTESYFQAFLSFFFPLGVKHAKRWLSECHFPENECLTLLPKDYKSMNDTEDLVRDLSKLHATIQSSKSEF